MHLMQSPVPMNLPRCRMSTHATPRPVSTVSFVSFVLIACTKYPILCPIPILLYLRSPLHLTLEPMRFLCVLTFVHPRMLMFRQRFLRPPADRLAPQPSMSLMPMLPVSKILLLRSLFLLAPRLTPVSNLPL